MYRQYITCHVCGKSYNFTSCMADYDRQHTKLTTVLRSLYGIEFKKGVSQTSLRHRLLWTAVRFDPRSARRGRKARFQQGEDWTPQPSAALVASSLLAEALRSPSPRFRLSCSFHTQFRDAISNCRFCLMFGLVLATASHGVQRTA